MHGNVARSGASTSTRPDAYAVFAKITPADRQAAGRPAHAKGILLRTARGGSWDDDPDELRAASRKVSNREWSVQDPQRPQSIWWHTDATRSSACAWCVRSLEEQENLKGFRSPVVKGKGSR